MGMCNVKGVLEQLDEVKVVDSIRSISKELKQEWYKKNKAFLEEYKAMGYNYISYVENKSLLVFEYFKISYGLVRGIQFKVAYDGRSFDIIVLRYVNRVVLSHKVFLGLTREQLIASELANKLDHQQCV